MTLNKVSARHACTLYTVWWPLAKKSSANQCKEKHNSEECIHSISSLLLLPPKAAKSREILRKFELIVVQGHRSIDLSVELRIMQLPTSH